MNKEVGRITYKSEQERLRKEYHLVFKRGTLVFEWRTQAYGNYRVTFGTNLEKAKAKALQWIAAIEAGIDPRIEEKNKTTSIIDFFTDALKNKKLRNTSANTVERYQNVEKNFLYWCALNKLKRIDEVTSKHMAQYFYDAATKPIVPNEQRKGVRAVRQNGASPKTLEFEKTYLKYVFQHAISEGQQCAQIDSLIEKKQRMLGLLDEKRRAVITQAVTRGLDPTVPMKDSGVKRLGEVPKGWEVKPLKTAIMFQRGHDLPADHRDDGAYPLVSSSGISGVHSVAVAKGPGIVTGRYGTLGIFYFIDSDYWPLNTTLYSIDIYKNIPKFLYYMLSTLTSLIKLYSIKSAVPGIDRNDLHPTKVVLPPIPEQQAIADYLDAQCATMDSQRKNLGKSIELLREYRASIITHAVTGKIDVRDVAPLQ